MRSSVQTLALEYEEEPWSFYARARMKAVGLWSEFVTWVGIEALCKIEGILVAGLYKSSFEAA
jgi:hypothetical protein